MASNQWILDKWLTTISNANFNVVKSMQDKFQTILDQTFDDDTTTVTPEKILNDVEQKQVNGPWRWWSSGQRARLLLRRSEFESRWTLSFFWKICVWKETKNKKRPWLAHFKNRNGWTADPYSFYLSCFNSTVHFDKNKAGNWSNIRIRTHDVLIVNSHNHWTRLHPFLLHCSKCFKWFVADFRLKKKSSLPKCFLPNTILKC